jgi:tetratricopeptide (TPR) repeat protein
MTSSNGSNGSNGNGGGGGGTGVRDPELDRARLRAVHQALTAGDIPTAGKLAEDALNDGIDHPMVLNLVAGRREAEGRLEEALALLQRALAAAPGAVGILNAIGLCLTRLGRFDEAVATYGEALAKAPDFAPAFANRATALMALARLNEAQADYRAAAAIDPGNLIAANGLAALALRRGDAAEARRQAEAVLAREPDFPAAVLTLAGADIAEGRPGPAEAMLAGTIGDSRLDPLDRAFAWGLRGDALDALGRFPEAFAAWREANALQRVHYAPEYGGRPGTLALVRELTAALAGRRVPAAWGHGGRSPAKSHVFLVGFPRSGTTLLEQVLEEHPEITTLAEKEGLVDATRQWLADAGRIARFCEADDEALEPFRDAYWRRVAAEGADPAGRVFVDKHPFNTFKLPLIARLFPDARVLFARRDPRDTVLSCFRQRFQMTDPVWQMLSLEGTAELYAATMAMAEASEAAFGLFTHDVRLEALIADFDGETKAVCDFIGVPWDERMRDFAANVAGRGVFTPSGPQLARGLNAQGVGKWRDYAEEMEPVLEVLAPWVARFGVS